jgi:hypothetical protein
LLNPTTHSSRWVLPHLLSVLQYACMPLGEASVQTSTMPLLQALHIFNDATMSAPGLEATKGNDTQGQHSARIVLASSTNCDDSCASSHSRLACSRQ